MFQTELIYWQQTLFENVDNLLNDNQNQNLKSQICSQ